MNLMEPPNKTQVARFEGKPCSKCHGTLRYPSGGCVACRELLSKEYAATGRTRSYALAAQYRLTVAEFERLLREQGNVCACCGSTSPGNWGTWKVDHDHSNGEIRGILCNKCNSGIGILGDTAEALTKVLEYLKRKRPTVKRIPEGTRIKHYEGKKRPSGVRNSAVIGYIPHRADAKSRWTKEQRKANARANVQQMR